jgi:hypothetical protein
MLRDEPSSYLSRVSRVGEEAWAIKSSPELSDAWA